MGRAYLGPDVTARFDSIELEQVERDRVRISGVVGEAPPSTLKVAMNEMGGYRNSFTVALTGLDIEAKAELAAATFWDACTYGPDDFDAIDSRVIRTDKADPATQEEATAMWRVTVKDADERKVGRAFADANVHTALASIPGMYGLGGGPSGATPFGVYRPAKIDAALVPQYVHVVGGATSQTRFEPRRRARRSTSTSHRPQGSRAVRRRGPRSGSIVGARSGDKGGNANLGVFTRSADAFAWLDDFLTVERLGQLLPEVAAFEVERFRFPEDLVAQLRDPRPPPGRCRSVDPPGRARPRPWGSGCAPAWSTSPSTSSTDGPVKLQRNHGGPFRCVQPPAVGSGPARLAVAGRAAPLHGSGRDPRGD